MKSINVIHFKYFNLLSVFYSSILFIAVFFDYKFIKVFGFFASSATFIVSITFFLGDLMTEVYGLERTRQIIWANIFTLVFFAAACMIFNQINTPIEYEKYGFSYGTLLPVLPRACLSNAFAIFIGMFLNTCIISKWKILIKGRRFWLRSFTSSACGEIIYTIAVVSLINVGIVPFKHLMQIFTVSYCFKFFFGLIIMWPASLLAALLKKVEGVDFYDYGISYNPFRFSLSNRVEEFENNNKINTNE
jgi:uncharacterized integral membrane protein (TIGR00697 family)